MCTVSWDLWLNFAPHWPQEYGLSSASVACVLMWSLMCPLNDLLQTSHLYIFFPSWKERMCLFKVSALGYALSQRWHWNSLLFSWSFWCVFRLPLLVNVESHSSHLYGLSPLWTLWWTMSWPPLAKHLPQSLQEYGFSPLWTLSCNLSLSLTANPLPHSLHLYGISPVCPLMWTASDPTFIMKLKKIKTKYLRFLYLDKLLATNSTLIWLVTSVFPGVFLHVILPGEPLTTIAACKSLLLVSTTCLLLFSCRLSNLQMRVEMRKYLKTKYLILWVVSILRLGCPYYYTPFLPHPLPPTWSW